MNRLVMVLGMLVLGRAAAAAPMHVYTDTRHVEAALVHDGRLWVATRGGVETYDTTTWARLAVLTTQEGLAESDVRGLSVEGGQLVARTRAARCTFATERFTCTRATVLAVGAPAVAEKLEGARVTVTLTLPAGDVVGTAGRGLFLRRPGELRPITPAGQICSNHVMAVAAWRGEVWLGSFDEGLCAFDGRRFRHVAAPARMVNDLAVTPAGLVVASGEGLWVSRDGVTFRAMPGVLGRSFTDLAWDAQSRTLWATSVNALWKIPAGRVGLPWPYYRPGGTRSLQAVDVSTGGVWLAAEDRGAIRMGRGRARFEALDRAAGLPTSWALDVASAADGGAYMATLRHGLLRVNADGSHAPVAGLPDGWLLHVSTDGADLMVGTQAGAAVVRGGQVRTLEALPDPRVHVMARIAGKLWVGTEGGTAVY